MIFVVSCLASRLACPLEPLGCAGWPAAWLCAIPSAGRAALKWPRDLGLEGTPCPQVVRKGPCEAVSRIKFTAFSTCSDFSFPAFSKWG